MKTMISERPGLQDAFDISFVTKKKKKPTTMVKKSVPASARFGNPNIRRTTRPLTTNKPEAESTATGYIIMFSRTEIDMTAACKPVFGEEIIILGYVRGRLCVCVCVVPRNPILYNNNMLTSTRTRFPIQSKKKIITNKQTEIPYCS